jgi:uncharacterized protein (TIGR02611 family)
MIEAANSNGAGGRPTKPAGRGHARWREPVKATLQLVRSNPTGRFALRVSVGLAGTLVMAIGIALIPLPGPGWLIVFAGLGIWAIEFVWAKDLLHFTRGQVHRWTHWVGRQSWPVRIVLGLAGVIFVFVITWASVKYSFGIDLVAAFWTYITTH